MKFSSVLSCVLAILFTGCLKGQNFFPKERIYFEVKSHYGFVLPHHSYIAYLVNEHIQGCEITAGLHTVGSKDWESEFNFPDIGLGYYHSNLGNANIFGNVNALFGYFDRAFFRQDKPINLSSRLGIGAAYINKKYDIDLNNFDVAIGSHFNVFLMYNLNCQWKISPRFQLKAGLGFVHTSNGNLRIPNKGINLVTSNIGLAYSIQPIIRQSSKSRKKVDFPANRNSFFISAQLGRKEELVPEKEKITPFGCSIEYGYLIRPFNRLGASMNVYFDPSLKKKLQMDNVKPAKGDQMRVSLNISYELVTGRLAYIFQPGWYIWNHYKAVGKMNNRFGLRYQLSTKVYILAMIKAHWVAKADFAEWGIGYRLNN